MHGWNYTVGGFFIFNEADCGVGVGFMHVRICPLNSGAVCISVVSLCLIMKQQPTYYTHDVLQCVYL